MFTQTFLAALTASFAHAAPIEYTDGHGDIRVRFEGGALKLYYRFDSSAVLDGAYASGITWISPDDAYVRVPSSVALDDSSLPKTAPWSFLGVTPDDDAVPDNFWTTSQNSVPGTPYFGFATEDLSSDWSATEFTLMGVSGPGEFSVWQTNFFGSPVEFYDTVDGGLGTAEDAIMLAVGAHAHYNWGFTAAGLYEVVIRATATHSSLGVFSDTQTFRFAVGDATVIPEPASAALVGLGGALILCRGRRGRFTRA